jgi:hypothetical protein
MEGSTHAPKPRRFFANAQTKNRSTYPIVPEPRVQVSPSSPSNPSLPPSSPLIHARRSMKPRIQLWLSSLPSPSQHHPTTYSSPEPTLRIPFPNPSHHQGASPTPKVQVPLPSPSLAPNPSLLGSLADDHVRTCSSHYDLTLQMPMDGRDDSGQQDPAHLPLPSETTPRSNVLVTYLPLWH